MTSTTDLKPRLQARFATLKASRLLPSPKGPALAVVLLTRQENLSVAQLVHVIQADPALAARLLKLANAGRAAGMSPILTVVDAVGILSLNAVRGLTLGLSLMADTHALACRAFDYPAFWSNNLARAVAMHALTAQSRLMQSDEAFTLGLLSRVGELGLASLFPDEYGLLLQRAQGSGTERLALERQFFEFDHAELTAALMSDWAFPAGLIEPVAYHEQSAMAVFSAGSSAERLMFTLMLAALIADICIAAKDKRRAMMANLFLLGGKLSIGAAQLMVMCDDVVDDWSDWCRLLDLPSPALPHFAELMNAPPPPFLQASGRPGVMAADGFRVMVVDDDPIMRKLLKVLLTKAGYQCSEAENGRQGLERACSERPDLMIVDWMMPEMNGIELIRSLRQTEIGRAIYVLLLTGLDQEVHLVDAFSAGADDFLSKPLKANTLTARLLAGQRVVTLQREIKRDQTSLQALATEFASLNECLQESYQRAEVSRKRMQLALHGGDLGMWDWHLPTGVSVFDERLCAMLGYRMDQIEPHVDCWMSLVHPDDRFLIKAAMRAHLKGEAAAYECEHRMRHKIGHWVWILDRGRIVERDATGAALRVVGTQMDITERKAAADEIEHLAYFDPLTDLPNRRLMLDRLGQALISSLRRNRHGALMLIDMDHFKTLNDTKGHDVGDQLLVAVASRIGSCVREGDTVARLGGDEFVVILEDLDETGLAASQAEKVAEKIQAQLGKPYLLAVIANDTTLNTHSHQCTSSIGISLFRDPSVSVDELMRRADTAMYQAKAAGRNTLRFFDSRMQEAVTARAAMEVDLRKAIVDQQFVLYYQAQVDYSGRVIGAEALVRWQHPERGLVSPAEFIPLAEETGLILPLGHWVLAAACAQLAAWATRQEMAELTLAVNVSARQFSLPTMVEEVLALVEHTGAPPARLKLELTESLLLENTEDIIAKMMALKARGVGFSMDDFGTGYSSLSYLKRLPLDQLKIDQSFVRDILTNPNDAAIARTIVALGQSLGLAVIAEGVETEGQRDFLSMNGCLAYQGYLFSRPLPLEGFEVYCDASSFAALTP